MQENWWLFHLTPRGWIPGTTKEGYDMKNYIDPPSDVVLTRKYCEEIRKGIGRRAWFEDYDAFTEEMLELLMLFPHPTGYEKFTSR